MASAWALSQRRIRSFNARGLERPYRAPPPPPRGIRREKGTPWSNRKTALLRFLKAVCA